MKTLSQDNHSLPVRDDGHNCFVCGPHNAIGLRVKFQLDGDVCRGEFTPGRDHCGYDGITHGGILFSLLDDVMANWLYLKGLRCFTAKCEIRYRNPLPVGCRARAHAGRGRLSCGERSRGTPAGWGFRTRSRRCGRLFVCFDQTGRPNTSIDSVICLQ